MIPATTLSLRQNLLAEHPGREDARRILNSRRNPASGPYSRSQIHSKDPGPCSAHRSRQPRRLTDARPRPLRRRCSPRGCRRRPARPRVPQNGYLQLPCDATPGSSKSSARRAALSAGFQSPRRDDGAVHALHPASAAACRPVDTQRDSPVTRFKGTLLALGLLPAPAAQAADPSPLREVLRRRCTGDDMAYCSEHPPGGPAASDAAESDAVSSGGEPPSARPSSSPMRRGDGSMARPVRERRCLARAAACRISMRATREDPFGRTPSDRRRGWRCDTDQDRRAARPARRASALSTASAQSRHRSSLRRLDLPPDIATSAPG